MPLVRFSALAVLLIGASAAPAAAATRYAAPSGAPAGVDCVSVAAPCTLARALEVSQADDTVSLASGTYPTGALTLPGRPLHWVATDLTGGRPVLTNATGFTVNVPAAASGSSFTDLEVVNTDNGAYAISVNAMADATISRSVVRGAAGCLSQFTQANGGHLTVEDSTLTASGHSCVGVAPTSVIRRSSIRTTGVDDGTVAAVTTLGLIVDSRVDGGLRLLGNAQASRVVARGSRALWGRGVVNDTLAVSSGPWPAVSAIELGELDLYNVTAISAQGPGVAAYASVVPDTGSPGLNRIVMTNSIARGTVDALATGVDCQAGQKCSSGQVRYSSSNVATTSADGTGAVIADLGGNQSDDPRLSADFHLLPGSPAIDAGVLFADHDLDLDGHPRVQGVTTDLGAYEATPFVPSADVVSPPVPTPDVAPEAEAPEPTVDLPLLPPLPLRDTTAPRLGRPALLPRAFRGEYRRPARVATTLTVDVDEAATVTAVLQPSRGTRLSTRLSAPGTARLRFRAHTLRPGTYRFVITATDPAGNRSAPRTATLRILPPR
jgi:hypothetical protein